jgi:hypothetical protein
MLAGLCGRDADHDGRQNVNDVATSRYAPSDGSSSANREALPVTTPDQPGWYDDPHDPNAQRYWNGQDWTPHRQRKPIVRSTQPPPPAQPPPPPSAQPLPPPTGATAVQTPAGRVSTTAARRILVGCRVTTAAVGWPASAIPNANRGHGCHRRHCSVSRRRLFSLQVRLHGKIRRGPD